MNLDTMRDAILTTKHTHNIEQMCVPIDRQNKYANDGIKLNNYPIKMLLCVIRQINNDHLCGRKSTTFLARYHFYYANGDVCIAIDGVNT